MEEVFTSISTEDIFIGHHQYVDDFQAHDRGGEIVAR